MNERHSTDHVRAAEIINEVLSLPGIKDKGLAAVEALVSNGFLVKEATGYQYATGFQIWSSDDSFELRPKYTEPDEKTAVSEAEESVRNGDGLVAMRLPNVDWELI